MTREGLYMAGAVFDVSYFDISEVLISSANSDTRTLRLRRASSMPGSHDIEIILPNETTFGPWPDDLFEAELHRRALTAAEIARRAAAILSTCPDCGGSGWQSRTPRTAQDGWQPCLSCRNLTNRPRP